MKNLLYILLVFNLLAACKHTPENKSVQNKTKLPPNILFIMADDHAAQAISAYRHEISKLAPTPNIDRIATNGVVFKNNFCTNSVCGPSRAVILTGKHSHINGFRKNGEIFDGNQPTLPKKLKKLGYQTAIIGKWHLHGFPQGFDYWKILNDQGNYYNPEFIHLKDTASIDKNYVDTTAHWAVNMKDTAIVKGYVTDLITDYAIDWLKEKKQADKPFFMMVHHKAPHRNWMPALRHLNKYDSIKFPLPATYFASHEGQQAAKEQLQTIYKDMYEGHDLKMTKHYGTPELAHNPWKIDFERMTPHQRSVWDSAYQAKNDAFHKANLKGEEMAEWKGQRYLQDYMATIASVDEGVGKILDYLEETGLDKNTLVVYTSDQGFYLGEKGWFDKRFMYEESMRMPLLMQLPGVIESGTTIEALTQNLDFADTFLDFAGGNQLNDDMQGESFKPLLEGKIKDENFRDVIYYHYYDFPAFHMVKKHYGVRSRRYKLMHFYDDIDAWEFYDLEKDPQELHNAINDKEYEDEINMMRYKLDSIQKYYRVTEKEFEKASKVEIEKAYKTFEKLRGNSNKN
ncbi:sulfatase family protein [Abyssalbus ytuae]|uniref:Sulfatase n=1 Tax=Abyssalbus ytuae TaxID=2926907 RepID=A0A9E6ZMT0_9FLAO|nr:sulfatase [Abyssalbus ytuae]UOB17145.1 sulfatase [Abyssalbus ytuae]